jgi:hypothetical protein
VDDVVERLLVEGQPQEGDAALHDAHSLPQRHFDVEVIQQFVALVIGLSPLQEGDAKVDDPCVVAVALV